VSMSLSDVSLMRFAAAASNVVYSCRSTSTESGQVVGETMTSSLLQTISFRLVSVSAAGLSWPVRIWRAMSSVTFDMTCWPAKEMQVSRMAKTRAANGIDSRVNSIAVLPLRSRRKLARKPRRRSFSIGSDCMLISGPLPILMRYRRDSYVIPVEVAFC
jgi:hypothetical protein